MSLPPKVANKVKRQRGSNQLRIIGGEYRRRQIAFPDSEGLRPTPDRVRETLFNWLGQDLAGLSCLDLFAGAGGLGFEAASRGAAKVVMVEMGRLVAASLQENTRVLGAQAVEVVVSDALAWLTRNQTQFDVVFLDPPFASDFLPKVLAQLKPHLKENARVYIETGDWPDLVGWQVLREGKAGQVHYGLLCRRQGDLDLVA